MSDSSSTRRHKRLRCPRCGAHIHLREDDGPEANQCPECGLDLDRIHHSRRKGAFAKVVDFLVHPPGETRRSNVSKRREESKKWWNVVSSRYPCGLIALVLGGLSLPLGLMSGLAAYPAVGAVAAGLMGLLQRRSVNRVQGGFGAGLGVIGLALAILVAPAPPPPGESVSPDGIEAIHPVITPSGSTDLQSSDNPIF